jgi:hypothetical protein
MRGDDQQLQSRMFSYMALEDRIPADHSLRGVRKLVGAALVAMSKDFNGLCERALLRMIHTLREGYLQQAPKHWPFLSVDLSRHVTLSAYGVHD